MARAGERADIADGEHLSERDVDENARDRDDAERGPRVHGAGAQQDAAGHAEEMQGRCAPWPSQALFASAAERRHYRRTTKLLVGGAFYGLGLWTVNVYVIAPLWGWAWFPGTTAPLVQAIAHALFFGVPLAAYLDRAESRPAKVVVPIEDELASRRRAA